MQTHSYISSKEKATNCIAELGKKFPKNSHKLHGTSSKYLPSIAEYGLNPEITVKNAISFTLNNYRLSPD